MHEWGTSLKLLAGIGVPPTADWTIEIFRTQLPSNMFNDLPRLWVFGVSQKGRNPLFAMPLLQVSADGIERGAHDFQFRM